MVRSEGDKRRRRSKAQWLALFEAQADSDLSVEHFCDVRGLSVAAFRHAQTRYNERAATSMLAALQREEFVELALPAPVHTGGWDIELALGADVVLRLRRA